MIRVYLRHPSSFDADNGTERHCPRPGFYNVPKAVAADWVEEGKAFAATKDNKAKAFTPGESKPEQLDVGHVSDLEGYFTTKQPAPPPEPEPEPEPVAEEAPQPEEGGE